jgi:cytidyltransferase-like protein
VTHTVAVSGSFDDLRAKHVQLLHAASKIGNVHVYLWSDDVTQLLTGKSPKFLFRERRYLLESIRYMDQITLIAEPFQLNQLPTQRGTAPDIWLVLDDEDNPEKEYFCQKKRISYHVFSPGIYGFPIEEFEPLVEQSGRKKVLVTGSFDWLHSGHVRFFEECAAIGDLYVIVGHDDNLRLLKGAGHPMFGQQERLFMVQAVRYVKRAMISTGHGWMDAAPEVELIKPDIYAVNEDGDVQEKKRYCEAHAIEYIVLHRQPKPGLPSRESKYLREGRK